MMSTGVCLGTRLTRDQSNQSVEFQSQKKSIDHAHTHTHKHFKVLRAANVPPRTFFLAEKPTNNLPPNYPVTGSRSVRIISQPLIAVYRCRRFHHNHRHHHHHHHHQHRRHHHHHRRRRRRRHHHHHLLLLCYNHLKNHLLSPGRSCC